MGPSHAALRVVDGGEPTDSAAMVPAPTPPTTRVAHRVELARLLGREHAADRVLRALVERPPRLAGLFAALASARSAARRVAPGAPHAAAVPALAARASGSTASVHGSAASAHAPPPDAARAEARAATPARHAPAASRFASALVAGPSAPV